MNYMRQYGFKMQYPLYFSRHLGASLFVVFMAATLSGCATDRHLTSTLKPLDLTQLPAGKAFQPASYTEPTITISQWWQVWQDPQLNQLMSMLNETAPSIQLAQARLDRALSFSDLSHANRQLQGGISASMTADRYPDHYTYPDTYAGKTGATGNILATLRWRLDFWGKWKALDQAAALKVNAAGFAVDEARLSLQIAIASHYMQWYAAEQYQHNQLQQRQVLQRLIEIAQLKRRAGLTEQSSVLQAQLNLSNLERQLPNIQQQIQRHQHAISALLGQTPAFLTQFSSPKLQPRASLNAMPSVPLHWVGQRPDVVMHRQIVEANARFTDAARASFYPDIDLSAVMGLQSLGLNHLFKAGSRSLAIGPALNLPVFEQGRLRAELKGTIADYDESVAKYNQSLINAIQQVADDLNQLQSAEKQVVISTQALSHAQQLLHIKTQLVHKGLATQQVRLAAELVQLERAADLIQADQQIVLAQIALTGSLGGQWAFSVTPSKAKKYD